MDNLTVLERDVIRLLLAGNSESLAILRLQLQRTKVISRTLSGVGFFTKVTVPVDMPRIRNLPKFRLGDVNAIVPHTKLGLGFLLYVVDGALDTIEGYIYDEPWPDDLEGLVLSYSKGQVRDINELAKILPQ